MEEHGDGDGESDGGDCEEAPSVAKRGILIAIPLLVVVTAVAAELHRRSSAGRDILDDLSLGPVTISFPGDGQPLDFLYQITDDFSLVGKLGVPVGGSVLGEKPQDCSAPAENSVCAQWPSAGVSLVLYPGGDHCTTVEWEGNLEETGDCFDTSPGSHWYGGGEQFQQPWPLETVERQDFPFITGDMLQDGVKFYGGIIERYFLNSQGVAIYIHPDVPLFHTLSSGTLCFLGRVAAPFKAPGTELPSSTFLFKYDVCSVSGDPRETHMAMAQKYFGAPERSVDPRTLTYPIWSTWARYKENVNQTIVLDFAAEILERGFPNSQLEIDDNWETCYGEAKFDPETFPDPAAMIAQLNEMGFRTTAWITPFINFNCDLFSEVSDMNYFVKTENGESNALSIWWRGLGGTVDFTRADAVEWYVNRLRQLQEDTGLDSFKFDAGETNWLASSYSLYEATMMSQPEAFSTAYVSAVAAFGPMAEVRTGRRNQKDGIFYRMLDKLSTWDDNNGLATLIPSTLHSNIVGYPYVLPDMIGGNGYGEGMPEKELFIRWLQANVFMPALQFSYVPWQYDDETVQIALDMVRLHEQYAPLIIELAEEATRTPGLMINRPLWWIDPADELALTIKDEFLLGDSILVAPVLERGAESRNIYLPAGSWVDEASPNHPVYEGPIMLENYPAPLAVLPYFSKAV